MTPPLGRVPATGVVTVAESEFGRNKGGFRTASAETSRVILSQVPSKQKPPLLPVYTDLDTKVSREIRTEKPRMAVLDTRARTGAVPRTDGGTAVDPVLMKTRILGERAPVRPAPAPAETKTGRGDEPRNTGAVERAPRTILKVPATVNQTPPIAERPDDQSTKPQRTEPRRQEMPRNDPPAAAA
jgi:hypothetical protein